MAKSVAQMVYLLNQQGKTAEATFYDPDQVEAKNIPRQDFYAPELGLNKAQTLAARWSLRLGIPITGSASSFSGSKKFNQLKHWNSLVIIVGCVDSPEGRNAMASCLTTNRTDTAPSIWWLDLGNTESSGQVVLGSSSHAEPLRSAFSLEPHCTALPSPVALYPSLIQPKPERSIKQPQSCADLALLNAQSQTVNMQCAAIATDYLYQMLFGNLYKFATEFDLVSGTMQSRSITPKQVGAAIKQDESWFGV